MNRLLPSATVWKELCLHMNGAALGPMLQGLQKIGALENISGAGRDFEHAPAEVPSGVFQLALHVLVMQGILERSGPSSVSLTERGRTFLRRGALKQPSRFLEAGRSVLAGKEKPDLDWLGDAVNSADFSDSLFHLEAGALASAVAILLFRLLGTDAWVEGNPLGQALGQHLSGEMADPIATFLTRIGWASPGADLRLTQKGCLLPRIGTSYLFCGSYLPLFAEIPAILAGKQSLSFERSEAGNETHLDRKLDIAFSGHVYRKGCRKEFLKMVLPIFDHSDFKKQPVAVVDTGSGDGSLLVDLYQQVRERTARGQVLREHPLTMIGAEYNEEARETTASRLASEEIPHQTLFGDIGNPEAITHELGHLDLGRDDVLHVSKSIFHNRTYAQPRTAPSNPTSSAICLAPDGSAIAPADFETNLQETMIRWRSQTGRHGLMIIESHIAPEERVVRAPNWNIMTCVETAHVLSQQLLVEADVFESACDRAGFRRRAITRLDPQQLGAPTMTLQHLTA